MFRNEISVKKLCTYHWAETVRIPIRLATFIWKHFRTKFGPLSKLFKTIFLQSLGTTPKLSNLHFTNGQSKHFLNSFKDF